MNWHIEQACPQCGAPVEFQETDHLFGCPFCRANLLMVPPLVFRYCLPARDKDRDDLVYIPYWRFKGVMYSCVPFQVKHKILDANTLAFQDRGLPFSIGIRAQAMKLSFAYGAGGRFIKPIMKPKKAMSLLVRRVHGFDVSKEPSFHREFIGERISLIYSPVYEKSGKVMDAVQDKPLGVPWTALEKPQLRDKKTERWQVQFIPTQCQSCGWDLSGEKDSLVLLCSNCLRAYELDRDKIREVTPYVASEGEKGDVYLPFWKLQVESAGLGITSFADLVKVAKIPMVVQQKWHEQRSFFWIPAFKIRPDVFLRLAKQMTLSRLILDEEMQVPTSSFAVTLPSREAAESVLGVFASLTQVRQKIFPKLEQASFQVLSEKLVYVPFVFQGSDAVQPVLGVSLSRPSLEFGRAL